MQYNNGIDIYDIIVFILFEIDLIFKFILLQENMIRRLMI